MWMHLLAVAWLYVTVLMALAEATAPNGTLLGAFITFVFYGLLPLSVLLYIAATPARKRARRIREEQASMHAPDASSHAPAAAQAGRVTPVREET